MSKPKTFINENDVVILADDYVVEKTRQIQSDGDIHIIPDTNLFQHIDSAQCGCNPTWNEENRQDWMGNRADYRDWETDRKSVV